MSYSSTILAESTLVGYWPLDDTSGTTAVDAKTGSYPLTYAGGFTLSQTSVISTGTSVQFNGSTGWASRTGSPNTSTSSGSLEAWWVVDRVNANRQIIAQNGHLEADGWGLSVGRYDSTNLNHLWIMVGGLAWLDTGITMVVGKKYHGVLDLTTGGNLKLYLNGILVYNGYNSTIIAASGVDVGSDNYTGLGWYQGRVDEVAIYSAPLGQAKALAHFRAACDESGYTPTAYDALIRSNADLISYWPMNETSGTVAYDRGSINPGTYAGTYTLAQPFTAGLGVSPTFTRSTGTMTASTVFMPKSNAIAIEAWCTPSSLSQTRQQIAWMGQMNLNGWGLVLNGNDAVDNSLQTYTNAYTTVAASPALTSGPNHVVWNVASNGSAECWVNGTRTYNSTPSPGTYGVPVNGLTVALKSGGGESYGGLTNHVAFYNAPLSSSDVAAHYAAGMAIFPVGLTDTAVRPTYYRPIPTPY